MPKHEVKRDTPEFMLWSHENLAKYAREQYLDNINLREALEQVRLDLKDALTELRKHVDDWK